MNVTMMMMMMMTNNRGLDGLGVSTPTKEVNNEYKKVTRERNIFERQVIVRG
jgi:hypothetical protein